MVFGKHGEAIADYITKGRQVLVEGRIEISASGHHNVVADKVRLGTQAGEPHETGLEERKLAAGESNTGDDLEAMVE